MVYKQHMVSVLLALPYFAIDSMQIQNMLWKEKEACRERYMSHSDKEKAARRVRYASHSTLNIAAAKKYYRSHLHGTQAWSVCFSLPTHSSLGAPLMIC